MNNHKNNRGFTLIELMVTVAIVGIFASIALPSFAKLIESNRISSATNVLMSNLLLARSEALKRSATVTLCPSNDQVSCATSNDYSQGWIVFLDCDNNGARDQASIVPDCGENNAEEIIKVGDAISSIYMVNQSARRVSFGFSGRLAINASSFEIGKDISDRRKKLSLNRVGRVKACNIYDQGC